MPGRDGGAGAARGTSESVTIQDVARQARVSMSTVSRVLNGHTTVADELTARVQVAVERLGYRPNAVARSLRRQVAAVWQLIISDVENPFFTSMVRGVEDVAQAAGYSVVLCNSDEDLDKERRYIEVAISERMSGVILSPASEAASDVGPLLGRGVPVVAVDRVLSHPGVDMVLVDNVEGARVATSELLAGGFRDIACVTGPLRTTSGSQRLSGYRQALAEHGRPYRPELVRVADFKEAGGYGAAESLAGAGCTVDAIFVANNRMTMGVLTWLARQAPGPGGELGLVGFDDVPWADLTRRPLTTVAQPTYAIGETAGRLLLERRDHPERPGARVVLQPTLKVRASSRRS